MCHTSHKAEKENVLSGIETDEDGTISPPPVITQPVVKTSAIGTGMKLKRNVEVCYVEIAFIYYHIEKNTSVC